MGGQPQTPKPVCAQNLMFSILVCVCLLQNVMSWAIPWRHNDGAYTKLAMGPLWAEIMDNIRPIISKQDPPPNKLALVSAHDTTLAPLLVSLGPHVWDGQWPPYASMIIIEVRKRILIK